MLQAFKEYKERNNLNPNLGNLWGCFWESCNLKERGFWEAALEHHARHSLSDDGKVYHAITFGEDYPGYKPRDDESPSDKPVNNDQRFCYYTEVKWWKECQVKEERTLRVASDKVQSWLDLGYTTNPDLTAVFPPSQEEANQATTANKKGGKGARKRPSSVPPGSDTTKAKQARAQADTREGKANTKEGRIIAIPKQELSAIAAKLTAKVRSVIPTLNPRHYRTIQNLAGEWYKALYHTKFQLTKSDYLKHLYQTAEGYHRAKETNPTHLETFIKALDVLKYSVNAPTTAGLRDPSSVQSDLAAAQQQSKPKKDKPAVESYAAAVTGQSATKPLPIGAKMPSAKASEKLPSGAIGAPIAAKPKAISSAGNVPAGTASTANQGPSDQQDANITSTSALEFLANAPGDQSFADYQATQGSQPAQDIQSGQSTPVAQDSKAGRDARTAQSTQSASSISQSATQAQDAGVMDLDDEDEAVMQQVLWQSRQQTQMQGADPTASSSTGGPAIQARSIEEEVQDELEKGRGFQEEASSLEQIMLQRCLTPFEVDRLRTVTQMINANKQRVVELCEAQVRENQAKQARDTSAMLASLKPLQPSKPKPQAQRIPPKCLHHLWL